MLSRLPLACGRVTVCGGTPGDRALGLPGPLVGYMPQTTSLHMEFTVEETFNYFGRLLKMSKKEVVARREELLSLLDLPLENRHVSRISFDLNSVLFFQQGEDSERG